jgi:serine/threonine-protein kinase RsbW
MVHPANPYWGEMNDADSSQLDSPDSIQLEVPAQVKYLGTITACVRAAFERINCAPPGDQDRMAVELAVHEACANIIEHAYQGKTGKIRMTIDYLQDPCGLAIMLQDTGKAASLENVKEPNLDGPQEKGYGLFLMQQLMDSVEYFPEDGNNRWRLVKRL